MNEVENQLSAVRDLAAGLFAEAHGWSGHEDRSSKLGDRSGSDDRGSSADGGGRRGLGVTTRNGYRKSGWWRRAAHKVTKPVARNGEVRLVDFCKAEMARCGVSRMVVYERLMAGKYLGVTIRKPAARVTFVKVGDGSSKMADRLNLVNKARVGEVAMKEFVNLEMARFGLTMEAIYNRVKRGRYAHMEFRRVNQRVVFVKAKEFLTTDKR